MFYVIVSHVCFAAFDQFLSYGDAEAANREALHPGQEKV